MLAKIHNAKRQDFKCSRKLPDEYAHVSSVVPSGYCVCLNMGGVL